MEQAIRYTPDAQGGRLWVVGHRGASGHAPENTMASFHRAVALGADFVELDVHLSRDGALVVIHDFSVGRTTNGSGAVRDLTVAELRALDAGGWYGPAFAGERIPTLDEVLGWASGQVRLVIEIKNGPFYYEGIEERLVAALRAHSMAQSALVISFDHPSVRRVKELDAAIATGILYVARPVDAVTLAHAAGASVLLPHWAFVTAQEVEAAHGAGLAVCPWVVDEVTQMEMVLGMGVDGLGTNFPDRVRTLLATPQSH